MRPVILSPTVPRGREAAALCRRQSPRMRPTCRNLIGLAGELRQATHGASEQILGRIGPTFFLANVNLRSNAFEILVISRAHKHSTANGNSDEIDNVTVDVELTMAEIVDVEWHAGRGCHRKARV